MCMICVKQVSTCYILFVSENRRGRRAVWKADCEGHQVNNKFHALRLVHHDRSHSGNARVPHSRRQSAGTYWRTLHLHLNLQWSSEGSCGLPTMAHTVETNDEFALDGYNYTGLLQFMHEHSWTRLPVCCAVVCQPFLRSWGLINPGGILWPIIQQYNK